jgi:predicted TIM-barrel fold metal-dependent hydrolase
LFVDAHAHVVSDDHERYPLSPLTPGRSSDWVHSRPATCERLIAEMDAANIERVVLVHSTSAYGYENGYEADCAARHPHRFVAVGGIDALAADAPQRITYWIRERGLSGVRIYAAGTSVANDDAAFIDDPASFPAWETIAELGIPMVLQVRFHVLPRVETLLARFPQVPIILDNLASPPLDDGPPYALAAPLFALAKYPQLYLKVTSILLRRDLSRGRGDFGSFFARAVAEFGAERILWGSNFPGSAGTLAELRALAERELASLPGVVRQQIFSGTALRLYPGLA